MVAIKTFALAVMAVAGASAFKKACNAPYDQCGYTLANDVYGTHLHDPLSYFLRGN